MTCRLSRLATLHAKYAVATLHVYPFRLFFFIFAARLFSTDVLAAGASTQVCVTVTGSALRYVPSVYLVFEHLTPSRVTRRRSFDNRLDFSSPSLFSKKTTTHILDPNPSRLVSPEGEYAVQSGNYTLSVGGSAPGSRGQGLGPDPHLLTQQLVLVPAV